jgi:hypothetical protein
MNPRLSLLHEILGEISTTKFNEGKEMLSVLVIRKDTRICGEGFFSLAKNLYPQTKLDSKADKKKFWEGERNKIYTI